MDHINGVGNSVGSQMYLYITADVNTTVKVEIANIFSQSYNVVARDILSVPIPSGAFLGTQGTFNKGIHITSEKSIAVYAHIFAESVSGATLLLPVNTLGKDYVSINYTQASNSIYLQDGRLVGAPSYSTFDVIGTEANTRVEITPSQTLLDGKAANKPFTVILNKGDVYQGLSASDLTGTRIHSLSNVDGSCKKVAVFSGSSKIAIGCKTENYSSDNLFQQVYPTASWGKSYITAPLRGRNYDVFRIILSDPDTKVSLNGNTISSHKFINRLYYEFNSQAPNVITADKPIQVAQYAVTQLKTINCIDKAAWTDTGDPEMIYLNPLEQTIDHVTLYSTSKYKIINNYINVVIKKDVVPTFTLDGAPYTSFTTVPGNPAYAYAQVKVGAGVHYISAAEGFNAIAYGFGYAESYGYAAGTNLKNLNEFITLHDPITGGTQSNGCTNVEYQLQLTLPFMTTDIKWDFKNGSPVQDVPNPVPKSTIIKDGKPLYIYEYGGNKMFSSGDHSVVASVLNPVANDCGSIDDIEFDFNIADPPGAKFSFTGTCTGEPTIFKDMTITNGRDIKAWLWDFGDGKTAVVQNPSHTYTLPGNYPVRLTVTNQNGCSSVFNLASPVHIGPKAVADFNYAALDCPGMDIVFTDNSSQTDGVITKWLWDFGDGSAIVERKDKAPFTHQFATAGSYVVKLIVVNTNGCASEVKSKVLVIRELPKADFTLPDVCTSDVAKFENKSSITDNTDADFIYEWNFGDDAHATSINPNTSTQKNPTHKYIEARNDYQVTLKVTSKDGCTSTKKQTLVVYDGDVKANVTLLNSNDLCSNHEVLFVNNSTNNVTRLEVTYDSGDPATTVVYNHPVRGQLLSHTYPVFTDGTRNYNVKVTAYSGSVCIDYQILPPFTLNAIPVITFTQTPPLCPENRPVQLVPSFIGAIDGTGVYSGIGVSTTGLFSPATAGTGTFNIVYTYTTAKGCSITVPQQITVYPSPTVSAGEDFTILEDVSVTIKATANNAIAYKWYPSIGLDHDDVLNPIASPTESTTYRLMVTSATNCTAMDEVKVKVLKKLIVPNTFTPNGDGYNDVWEIKYLSAYPNNTVDVYSRYGAKLYSSVGYGIPWDGKYKGADVPPGTYYYIINPKNGRKVITGSVTIIR